MDIGGVHYPGRAVWQGGPEDQRREYGQNGLPTMSGGGNTVRGRVQEKDDVSGDFLPVEAEFLL